MESANFQHHAKIRLIVNFSAVLGGVKPKVVVVHGKRVKSSKVSGRFPGCSLKVVNTLNRFRFFLYLL